jgi:hypothetical protein
MAKVPDKNADKEKEESEQTQPLAGGIKGAGGPAVPISAEDVMTEQAKEAAKAEKTAAKAEKPEEKAEEKPAKEEKK